MDHLRLFTGEEEGGLGYLSSKLVILKQNWIEQCW